MGTPFGEIMRKFGPGHSATRYSPVDIKKKASAEGAVLGGLGGLAKGAAAGGSKAGPKGAIIGGIIGGVSGAVKGSKEGPGLSQVEDIVSGTTDIVTSDKIMGEQKTPPKVKKKLEKKKKKAAQKRIGSY